jgi:hypothetical protein
MSNHFSAAGLKFPGDDARLDLTDLYVFVSPQDPNKTVLILDANPFWAGIRATVPFVMTSGFHPDGVYRINIHNSGALQPDASFTFVFSGLRDGGQTATAYFATGSQARQAEPTGEILARDTPVGFDAAARPIQAGPCRLFVGVRSDPFFADAEGALHGFQWTGQDAFAKQNVLSIALEVPNEMLGTQPAIGVWAVVSVRRDGMLWQMDRGGHPTINPFINPDELKDEYNAGQPADDVARYRDFWAARLQRSGGYSAAEATAAANSVLPDILRYDRAQPAGYPNGRILTDDVFSTRMSFLTNGKVGASGVGPHDDMLAEFPFLGLPNSLPDAPAK